MSRKSASLKIAGIIRRTNKVNNWKHHVIELFMVFIGVSAAFMLDNWQEKQKGHELTKNYLNSFLSDVRADSKLLNTIIPINETKQEKGLKFYKEQLHQPVMDADLANNLVMDMLSLAPFRSTKLTYESIRNSGHLASLSNYQLIEKLVSYYEESVDFVEDSENVYRDWLGRTFTPYIDANYDLVNMKFISDDELSGHRFRNIAYEHFALQAQKVKSYKNILEQNKELEAALIAELKKY